MNKYRERIARVCAEMKKAGIGQLMVNDHLGIYYLTGIDVMPFERFWAFLINDDGSRLPAPGRMQSAAARVTIWSGLCWPASRPPSRFRRLCRSEIKWPAALTT